MNDKNRNLLIWIISIAVPVVVGVLFFLPGMDLGVDVSILPAVNASINGTVAVLLILALWMIKVGNRKAHQWLMTGALSLSALFLVSYVIYHSATESTPYGGEGVLRTIYFLVLISHIVLAAIILPLVLITFSRALGGHFDKHKKIARITFPLWLYVAVTGVVVYVMISPYY